MITVEVIEKDFQIEIGAKNIVTSCDPATVTATNSLSTVLGTVSAPSGGTGNIPISDSPINKSDGTLIANVPAETSYNVADSVITVEYVNGTPISTNNVKAASTATIQVPNPTTLQDAIDTNTATDIANAIDTANKENDVFTDLAPLVTNQTIEDGISVAQRNTLTRLEFLKQGETPVVYQAGDFGTYNRGRGASFLTLSVNNPNGNTNRFELLGTDVVIDWGLGCYWTKALQANAILANHISTAAALTLEGLSTWYVPGLAELSSICDMYLGDPLNYAPFNLVIPNFSLLTSEFQPNVNTTIKSMFFFSTSRGCLPALRTTSQAHPALYFKPF